MVLWITAAQVAFGSNVLADGLQNFFREPVSQQPGSQLFMPCIDSLFGDVFTSASGSLYCLANSAVCRACSCSLTLSP
jgi:H+/gluconate symporter-like permease